jgi:hypothetical protein
MNGVVKHWLLVLALCLYVAACFCPALETTDPDGLVEETIDGWKALLFGWFTILTQSPVWLANPRFFRQSVSYNAATIPLLRNAPQPFRFSVRCGFSVITTPPRPTSRYQPGTTLMNTLETAAGCGLPLL